MACFYDDNECYDDRSKPKSVLTKMAVQKVFVRETNRPEYDDTMRVPVYSAEEPGIIRIVYHRNSVTKLNEHGDCEQLILSTGTKVSWYARPNIAAVVTMNMREKVGGYFFQFHKDGSISSSCELGTYHWGPIEESIEEEPLGETHLNAKYYDEHDLNLWRLHRDFVTNSVTSRDYDDY